MAKQQPLTFRQRYYARARYLSTLERFARDMDATRRDWNAAYPQYATSGSESVLQPPSTWGDCVYPRRLGEAVDAQNDEGRRTGAADDPRRAVEGGALDAQAVWDGTVAERCRAWWPPEHFPTWTLGDLHPASWFVSASLVSHPREIKLPFIRTSFALWMMSIHEFSDDPLDITSNSWVRGLQANHSGFMERLRSAIDEGIPITHESIESIQLQVTQELAERQRAALRRRQTPSREVITPVDRTFPHVRIIPGMAREDWMSLAESAVEASRSQQDDADAIADKMLRDDKSVNGIADALGLSRWKVRLLRDRLRKSRKQ